MVIRVWTVLMCLCLSDSLLAQGAPPIRWIAGGHSDAIVSVAYSPDGKLAASGSWDGTAKIWRVADGKLVRTLIAASGNVVRGVAFSADGKTLSAAETADTGGLVEAWTVATGAAVVSWQAPTVAASALAYAPGASALAVGTTDGSVALYSTKDGTLLRRLRGHTDLVRSLAFSSNGAVLASGSDDRSAKLWRVSDGTLLATLHSHTDRVTSVAFSPDGKQIASASDDTRVDLYTLPSGTLQHSLTDNAAGVSGVVFSRDSKTVFACLEDGTIRSWNSADGTVAGQSHVDNVPLQAIALAPNGQTFLTASINGTLAFRQTTNGDIILQLAQQAAAVGSLAFSNDDAFLAVGASSSSYYPGDGLFRIWRPKDGVKLGVLPGTAESPVVVGFTAGNSALAMESISANPAIPPWIEVVRRTSGAVVKYLAVSKGRPAVLGISPEGAHLVSLEVGQVTEFGELFTEALGIDVWDLASGKREHTIKSQGLAPHFATDGKILVLSSTIDSKVIIQIWRVSDGKLLNSFETSFSIYGLGVFPDDSAFVMLNEAGVVVFKISDGSGQLAGNPTGFGLSRFAFTPDGTVLAAASSYEPGTPPVLTIWHTSDAKMLATYTTELGTGIDKMTFSPDGSVLAVGRLDGTVFVMDNPGYVPPGISQFVVSQQLLHGGSTTSVKVTLSSLAPVDGAIIKLTSSDTTALVVPPTVTTLATHITVTGQITTRPVTARKQVTLTASYGGTTKTATLTIVP